MSSPQGGSPWLGGPGARWAQVLLFALHVAVLVSLWVLYVTYRQIRHRVPFERWQENLLLAGIGLSCIVFGLRAWRIGLDLWRALKARSTGGGHRPES